MKKKFTKNEILRNLNENNVEFMRLWFSDINGQSKNVEIPSNQFKKALDGQILFDGSSIEGFSRIEESDMLLKPDMNTYCIMPDENEEKVARIICDIKKPNNEAFNGCPRTILKKICKKAEEMGYIANIGAEAEFFLFERDNNNKATNKTHDKGGYFDLTPIDKGETTRRKIVQMLNKIGYDVEAAHHEVAFGQHEIGFKYSNILQAADNIITFKYIVRKVALASNLHATFMPKPIFGINGSGMHLNQSLFDLDNKNIFYSKNDKYQLSTIALNYIGGLLKHAKDYCAITNPIVNSYKRLVSGYEAPTHIVWSEHNRSPLIRIPDRGGMSKRVELRMPDPSCNPYLAFACVIGAGLDGIENTINPGPPINKNIFLLSESEKKKLSIEYLPKNLEEALLNLKNSELLKKILGEHIFKNFIKLKEIEWADYIKQVHSWEIDQYLIQY